MHRLRTLPFSPPARNRTGPRIARLPLLLALALAACDGRGSGTPGGGGSEPPAGPPPPPAEFVIAAGDSTFWVRSGEAGVAMRGSPLLLARADGRFYELYVTDDDRSFYDAVFVGQRLWRRDVVTDDSALLFADTAIARLADQWARDNPHDTPLAPGEAESEEPLASASGELAVLDVVGPYVSYEWFTDLHPLDAPPSHRLRRGVLDLRTARPVSLAALVGEPAARALEREGARLFRLTADSLRGDGVVPSDYDFDPSSFALAVENGRPVIAFIAPARIGTVGDVGGLPLPPLPIATPRWWTGVRGERGTPARRGPEERWTVRPGLELVARAELEGDVRLLLRATGERVPGNDSAPRRGRSPHRGVNDTVHEWTLGHVSPPVQRVYWLDRPPLAPEVRAALHRAFDDADRYEDELPATPPPPRSFASREAPAAAGPPGGGQGSARLASRP